MLNSSENKIIEENAFSPNYFQSLHFQSNLFFIVGSELLEAVLGPIVMLKLLSPQSPTVKGVLNMSDSRMVTFFVHKTIVSYFTLYKILCN